MPHATAYSKRPYTSLLTTNDQNRSSSYKIGLLLDLYTLLIWTRKAGGGLIGGVQTEMAMNKLSLDLSLLTAQERWGLGRVQNMIGSSVWAYRMVANTTSGTWTTVTNIGVADGEPLATAGTQISAVWSNQTNANRDYLVTVPPDGKLRFAFLGSTSGNGGEAELSDSGSILAVVNTNVTTGNSKLIIREITTQPGQRTIRVRHIGNGSGTKVVYVLGIHFCSLEHPPTRGATLDTYASFRNANMYCPNGESENWYAFWDWDANLWGGGFHGGESNLVAPQFLVDGIVTTLTVGVPFVFRSFAIKQRTRINWVPHGGGYLDVDTEQDLSSDGVINRSATFAGSMRMGGQGYTHMMSCGPGFVEGTYPQYQLFSGTGKKAIQGRSPMFRLRNPTTGQVMIAEYNLQDDERGLYTLGSGHLEMRGTDNKQRLGLMDYATMTETYRPVTTFNSKSIITLR